MHYYAIIFTYHYHQWKHHILQQAAEIIGCIIYQFEYNVMKQMNRSQSYYRQSKVPINEPDHDKLMSKYATRQNQPKNQFNIPQADIESNKENNSFYQSASESDLNKKSRERGSDPKQEIIQKLEIKCKKQEDELKILYKEKDEQTRELSKADQSKTYNYCERYYLSEIEKMKSIIKQKDAELQQMKMEFSARNEMDLSLDVSSTKFQKIQRDKNLYIKEINNKAIQISHLQQRVKIHKAEIETLKLYINEKDQSIQDLQDRIGQVDMKRKKIQNYEYQIKESNQFLKELQLRTLTLKEETEQKDKIIFQKTKSIGELEQTLGSYEDKLHSIEDALIILKGERKATMEKNQQLMRQCEDWKKSYQDLLKKSQSLQQYQIKMKTYVGMVQNLNKKNMELASANEKYKINITNLEKIMVKFQEIEKDVVNLRKEMKQKQEKVSQLQAREKSHKLLEESYTKLRKEKDEYLFKIQDKNKENKQLNLQLEDYQNRVKCLEQQIRDIEEASIRVKDRGENMDLLMKENNKLNCLVLQKMTEVERLQIKLNNLENKINEKNNQILKMKAIIEERQQEIHQMDLQVHDLRERYQFQTNSRIMNEDKVLRCNQEIYAQQCTIDKLQSDNQELEQNISQLTTQIDKKTNKIILLSAEMENRKLVTENLLSDYNLKILTLEKITEEYKIQLEESIRKQKDQRCKLIMVEDQLIKLRQQNRLLHQQTNEIILKCQKLKSIYEFIQIYKDN